MSVSNSLTCLPLAGVALDYTAERDIHHHFSETDDSL